MSFLNTLVQSLVSIAARWYVIQHRPLSPNVVLALSQTEQLTSSLGLKFTYLSSVYLRRIKPSSRLKLTYFCIGRCVSF